MSDFPKLVFTVPGPIQRAGGNYGHEEVKNEDELKAALANGFYETLPDAIEAHANPKPKAEKPKAEK